MTLRVLVGLSLLVGCAGSLTGEARRAPAEVASGGDARPERVEAHDPPRSVEPRTEPAEATRESSEPGAEPTIEPRAIDADITAALSGQLTVDHLGPDALEATLARFARAPAAYLERFEARFFVRDGASMRPVPADVAPEILLAHLYPHAPEAVRRVAGRLRRIDHEALRDGRQTDPRGVIAARDAALGLLAAGVDLPFDESWSAVRPDDWCIDRAPVIGAVIRVERTCSCGEPLACAARLDGGALEVSVRVDEHGPVRCRDCYPTYAVCRLPSLPTQAAVPVVIEGARRGALTTSGGAITSARPCR